MKKLLTALVFTLCISLARAWVLGWNAPVTQSILSYYAPGTNEAYKIYGTNITSFTNGASLLAVVTNWNVSTNSGVITYSYALLTNDPAYFAFYITATNVSGESLPSNIALTGPPTEPVILNFLTPK